MAISTLLAIGCTQSVPPSSPAAASAAPLSAQDVYLKEVAVLEHLQREFDRIIAEQNRHNKSAEELLELALYWEKQGDPTKALNAKEMMEKDEEWARKAGDEATSLWPTVVSQQLRVDAAKKKLPLNVE